jgi:hypothetical protein
MCKRCLLLVVRVLLACILGTPAWGINPAIIFVSATAPQGGDGSSAAPFRALDDALALARSRSLPSVIQILPGRYPIHATGTDDRVVLDIADLTIQGSNQLTFSQDGFPSGVQPGTETLLFADPPLAGNQTIMKITAGNVTIKNLSFDGRTPPSTIVSRSPLLLGGHAAVFTVAQNATVTSNIMTGAFIGLDFNGSGTIQGNLLIANMGLGCGVGPADIAGPPTVNIRANRVQGNFLAALVLTGNNLYPGSASLLVAEVEGNDLSGGVASGFGSGLRIFAINPNPAGASRSGVTAQIRNNHVRGNFFPIVVDGGFPFRSASNSWSAQFDLVFEGNTLTGNASSSFVSFTRFTAFFDPPELSYFKYLQNSTFKINYSDGSFDGVLVDDPLVDPISADTLGNTLLIQKM